MYKWSIFSHKTILNYSEHWINDKTLAHRVEVCPGLLATNHKEEAWRTALQKGHHGWIHPRLNEPPLTLALTHTRPEICHTTKRRTKKRPKKLTQFVHKKPVCMQDIAVRQNLPGRNLGQNVDPIAMENVGFLLSCPSNQWDYFNFSDSSFAKRTFPI